MIERKEKFYFMFLWFWLPDRAFSQASSGALSQFNLLAQQRNLYFFARLMNSASVESSQLCARAGMS